MCYQCPIYVWQVDMIDTFRFLQNSNKKNIASGACRHYTITISLPTYSNLYSIYSNKNATDKNDKENWNLITKTILLRINKLEHFLSASLCVRKFSRLLWLLLEFRRHFKTGFLFELICMALNSYTIVSTFWVCFTVH